MYPNKRKLMHLTGGTDWDPRIHIGFVDYTGHRSKHNGHHFTAVHEVYLTEEELFDILAPYLKTRPGNEPDMVECETCGQTVYSDELTFDPDTYTLHCAECANKKGDHHDHQS